MNLSDRMNINDMYVVKTNINMNSLEKLSNSLCIYIYSIKIEWKNKYLYILFIHLQFILIN